MEINAYSDFSWSSPTTNDTGGGSKLSVYEAVCRLRQLALEHKPRNT